VPKNHSEPNAWKGALAGLVAGLVASWAMDRFQDLWVSLSPKDSTSDDKFNDNDREPANSNNKQSDNESDDDATVKVASTFSEGVFGHELTPEQTKIAEPAVHYAVGAAGGTVYGVAGFKPAFSYQNEPVSPQHSLRLVDDHDILGPW
jgi:putative membrane protein